VIQNAEVLNRLSVESKSAGFDVFPRKIAKKIQPVVISNVDHKENSFYVEATTTGFFMIISLPNAFDSDNYLVGCSMRWRTDLDTGAHRMTAIINHGAALNIMVARPEANIPDQITFNFPIPMKLDRGSGIAILNGRGAGAGEVHVSVWGYSVTNLKKADG